MSLIIFLNIMIGIPLTILILCIINIVKAIKIKDSNDDSKKEFIIRSIIFGIIFLLIIAFYIYVDYNLSNAIANM